MWSGNYQPDCGQFDELSHGFLYLRISSVLRGSVFVNPRPIFFDFQFFFSAADIDNRVFVNGRSSIIVPFCALDQQLVSCTGRYVFNTGHASFFFRSRVDIYTSVFNQQLILFVLIYNRACVSSVYNADSTAVFLSCALAPRLISSVDVSFVYRGFHTFPDISFGTSSTGGQLRRFHWRRHSPDLRRYRLLSPVADDPEFADDTWCTPH